MKVVLAIDSFKGCLSSEKAISAASAAFTEEDTVIGIPLSDGGEGFSSVVSSILGAETISAQVHDPLGREIMASYGLDRKTGTAIIETASASGLCLVEPKDRNPLLSSSFGTGELIEDALYKGARTVYLGLGGSATNDGGTGILQALGFRFKRADGSLVEPYRTILEDIAEIDDTSVNPLLKGCSFECFYDVSVPFFGKGGATYMFGPQKGLKEEDLCRVDSWMERLSKVYSKYSHLSPEKSSGEGAAGGIGYEMKSMLNAKMNSGIDKILDISGFDDAIKDCDLIITGEGKADEQTLTGKAPFGVLKRAQKLVSNFKVKPDVLLIAGKIKDREKLLSGGFCDALQITPSGMPIEWALDEKVASYNITSSIREYLDENF